jgi:hypothetical protein
VRYGVDDVRQLDVAGHGVDHLCQEAAARLVECLRIGESNSERESVTVFAVVCNEIEMRPLTCSW